MTITLSRPAAQPKAGWIEDEEERDNDLGPERDETDNRLRPNASAAPEPAPDQPPLPKRDPGKHLREEVSLSADKRLGSYLHRLVTEADAHIPAERRVPRTLKEMQARIDAARCAGAGGTR
ncbi:hypothetical protein [Streptomyces sp. NPDC058595]|uniref:hypothetical protein n=1 Tax=Streptomyces sp. NPDC058595 TaxID=3346550 RepID=UPI00365747A6